MAFPKKDMLQPGIDSRSPQQRDIAARAKRSLPELTTSSQRDSVREPANRGAQKVFNADWPDCKSVCLIERPHETHLVADVIPQLPSCVRQLPVLPARGGPEVRKLLQRL